MGSQLELTRKPPLRPQEADENWGDQNTIEETRTKRVFERYSQNALYIMFFNFFISFIERNQIVVAE